MERDFEIAQLRVSSPPTPSMGQPLLSQATTLFQYEFIVPLKKKRSLSNLRRLKSLFLLSDMVVTGQEMVKEK